MKREWLSPHMQSLILAGILLLAFAARSYHLDFPVSGFQAWRQADTAAMARNYYEQGFHFLYPQVDWGGGDGYVETEFPLYQFMTALLYQLFGLHDMFGRALSVLFALVSVLGIFALVKRTSGTSPAYFAAGFYALAPTSIFYTRAFMPESMMIMSSIWGVYHFLVYTEGGRPRQLIFSALLIALAGLLKITALFLGIPLVFLAWRRFGWRFLKSSSMWMFAFGVLVVVALWYYHAHRLFLESGLTFGIWMPGENKWLMWQPLLTIKFWNDVLFKSIAERHLTYAGFLILLVGLSLGRSNALERLYAWWLAGFGFFVMIVSTGNQIHEYYQLPFLVPAAAYIGKATDWAISRVQNQSTIRTRFDTFRAWTVVACLAAFPILSTIRVATYLRGERLDSSIFAVEHDVKEHIPPGTRIVALDEHDPIVLYRADRKGWHAAASTLNVAELMKLRALGAEYFVCETWRLADVLPKSLSDILEAFPTIVRNTQVTILSLKSHGE